MLNLLKIIPIACLFLLLNCALADGKAGTVEIINFTEEFNPDVKASGGVLVGFHVTGSVTSPNFEKLYIARPKETESLSLTLTSIDGKYKATMDVKFNEWESIWTEISIPSQKQQQLKKYSADELVAYAYIEIVDERSKWKKTFHNIYPVSWGMPTNMDEFAGRFFVNSGITAPKYNLNNTHHICVSTKSEINTAFNKYCELGEELKPGNNLVFIKAGFERKYLVWRPE